MRHTCKITAFLLYGLLTACSGNPLAHKPTHATASLLMKTSNEAMTHMGYNELSQSDRYRQCMESLAYSTFPCNKLYQTMAELLNHQGIPVQEKHLQDKTFYSAIASELEQLSYYSL